MAAGDWYYQVWEHFGLRGRVREVGTYKLEYDAQQAADRLNAQAKYYSGSGPAPSSFFFVQPVHEEHLREAVAENFRQQLQEDRGRALKHCKGTFRNLAEAMVPHSLYSMEHCPMGTSVRLDDHGGWLESYSTTIEPFGDIKCYVLFSGRDAVQLKVAIEHGKKVSITTVDIFESEMMLKDWLRNRPVATAAVEDRLLDLFIDRHRFQKEWRE